jgi:hypothetical protein
MFYLNYNIVLNDLNNRDLVFICVMYFNSLSYVIAIQAFTFYISGFGVLSGRMMQKDLYSLKHSKTCM